MPDCGVHYLWFAFVCFLIRSHPPKSTIEICAHRNAQCRPPAPNVSVRRMSHIFFAAGRVNFLFWRKTENAVGTQPKPKKSARLALFFFCTTNIKKKVHAIASYFFLPTS